MSSNVLHRLAAALTWKQSSSAVAGTVRYRPLLTPTNSHPQIRSSFSRPFISFSHFRPSFPELLIDQCVTKQTSWTLKDSQSFRSKCSIKTSNERRLGHASCKRPLDVSRARSVPILYRDLPTPLYKRSWPQNRIAWQILRSSSTDNRGEGRFRNSPLPHKPEAQIEKGTSESSKLSASSVSNKHIIDRLPNLPHIHKPTKEELLAAATGFWSRLKVRFKWFSIRSVRPFNVDEIGAFFSWVLLGHVLWIILGTTTFFSLAIFAVNTVFAQGMSLSPYSYVQLIDVQKLSLAG